MTCSFHLALSRAFLYLLLSRMLLLFLAEQGCTVLRAVEFEVARGAGEVALAASCNLSLLASYFLVGVLLRSVEELSQSEELRIKLLSASAEACSASARIPRSKLAKPCSTLVRTDCCMYVEMQWPCAAG